MSTSSLPPLRNLPNWTRVGILDRAHYPRLLSCECVHKCPPSRRDFQKATQTNVDMDADMSRVASLEKDILFLQETHKNTLEKLHEEIDYLKRANKEIQYRLIMESHLPSKESIAGDLHEKKSHTSVMSSEEKLETATEQGTGIITSLVPLKIHSAQSRCPHTPSLQECEAIIRQLYDHNVLQSQELLQMKTLLRNIVLHKKKMSRDDFTVTKAYLSDSSSGQEVEHFPVLSLKPLPKQQQPVRASARENVVLPAIRQSLSCSVTERQKRAQDVHRTRLRRGVNPKLCNHTTV